MRLDGITEHMAISPRHKTFYLAAGPVDGPLVVLVHGWPELSISWRHQLPMLAGLGFRAVAPDMRGYGRSSVYGRHDSYALEEIVAGQTPGHHQQPQHHQQRKAFYGPPL